MTFCVHTEYYQNAIIQLELNLAILTCDMITAFLARFEEFFRFLLDLATAMLA
jgi:hypothetical protein